MPADPDGGVSEERDEIALRLFVVIEQGVVSIPNKGGDETTWGHATLARSAYGAADAFLAERERQRAAKAKP